MTHTSSGPSSPDDPTAELSTESADAAAACPECGHAADQHYALGHVGCHDLRCPCARIIVAGSGLSAQIRGLAADPHARAVLAKAFREAPLANAAEALHAIADGLDAGSILLPRLITPPGETDPWDDLPRREAERQEQYDLEANPADPDEPHKCVVHHETRSQVQRNGSFVVTEYCERGHVVNHYVDSVL